MKNNQSQNGKALSRKKKFWLLIGIIVLLIASFNISKAIINAPRDLGSELTYIGTHRYGCHWWEALILPCDSRIGYTRFFATDMTSGELKEYFKNSSYIENASSRGGTGVSYTFSILDFKTLKNQKKFFIYYYNEPQAVINAFKLKQVGKKYIISLTEEDYQRAKEAL